MPAHCSEGGSQTGVLIHGKIAARNQRHRVSVPISMNDDGQPLRIQPYHSDDAQFWPRWGITGSRASYAPCDRYQSCLKHCVGLVISPRLSSVSARVRQMEWG